MKCSFLKNHLFGRNSERSQMQKRQAMFEILVAIGTAVSCVALSFIYNSINDPRKIFSYGSISNYAFKKQVWALYIVGYETKAHDKRWSYWCPESTTVPKIELDAAFSSYLPENGFYSSKNRTIIKRHLSHLTSIGVNGIIVPWIPPKRIDKLNPTFSHVTDKALRRVANQIDQIQIKIGIMIPDYDGRTWESISEDIKYYNSAYGHRSSILREKRRPVIFIENANKLNNTIKSLLKIRRTYVDSYFVGQFSTYEEIIYGTECGYDAITTTINQMSGDPSSWKDISKALHDNYVSFIPSVYPGYDVSKVKAFANKTIRNKGKTYSNNWQTAIETADTILINSFNNWYENTAIEPIAAGFKDPDWGEIDPDLYLKLTKKFSEEFRKYTGK